MFFYALPVAVCSTNTVLTAQITGTGKTLSNMWRLTSVFLLLQAFFVVYVISAPTKFRQVPKRYDKSFTLRVNKVNRAYDYGSKEWTTRHTSSHIIKRDHIAQRFQESNPDGSLVQVQQKENDGKVWTVCSFTFYSLILILICVNLFEHEFSSKTRALILCYSPLILRHVRIFLV